MRQNSLKLALYLAGMLLLVFAFMPTFASTAEGVIDPSLPPNQRCQALVSLSAKLVETAQSRKGHATSFRLDVAHYREALRDLLKDNDKLPDENRLPRALLLDMVRMVALLQSAAQCQTGRYIVCPPDLMDHLNRQQAMVEKGLAAMPAKAR